MKEQRRYYEAYDERYKQVHQKSLQWFSSLPSKIVEETITEYGISKISKILEIGCGEGRDAIYLMKNGYDLLATDVSPTAINYCKETFPYVSQSFKVFNCLTERINDKFDFIYAISILHMLVLDKDRNLFYQFIYEQLKENGIALIAQLEMVMRNGVQIYQRHLSCRKELMRSQGKKFILRVHHAEWLVSIR